MSDDDFGDDAPVRAQSYRRGGGRGRGRGGGGSRGGRGGSRGGFDDDGYGGGWDSSRHDDDDNGESGFGGGRGRGRRGYNDDDENGERGYGGGRGRGGRGRGGFGGGGDEERGFGGRSREEGEAGDGEKPKERYIPPEPTNDENELFGSGTTAGINFDQYENIKIKVSGENPVPPVDSFESCGLREFVYNNVKKSGYSKPTPVQKRAIPIIMAGRDLMACAQTGSGKTAAFLVPIINTLLDRPKDAVINEAGVEPQAVIMSPTRELAIQIFNEARKFAHGSILKVCIAYGGTVAYAQGNALMRGCHILVATPGRLNDFVNRERITFSSIRFFVLDEADRMLDMGFLPEIEKMLKHNTMPSPDARQTLMFSATFPPDIQRLAGNYFNNYLFLAVGIVGGACADVEQVFYEVPKFEKKEKLADILRESGGKQLTLVFVELKRNADFVAAFLCENKIPTTSIHGDRLQSQREQALGDFRSGRKPTLIATGVASRGLDIKNVAHVINFDLPNSIDEYVHRIGRTGRVGNRGKATSFFDPSHDSAIAGELVKILSQCNQPIPAFLESAGGPGGGDNGGFDGDSFGGRDVRKGRHDGGGFSAPAAQEVDEDW